MIRPATHDDLEFIGALSGEAFAPYGRYEEVIPRWVEDRSAIALVDDEDGERRGFCAVGFHTTDEAPVDDSDPAYVADLLAIAVAAEHRGRGIGHRLLERAIALARSAGRRLPVRQLVLSVAHTNTGARRLFESVGFAAVPGDHGLYAGGQRAIHMALPL